MNEIIVPFFCGLLSSLFFNVIHFCVKSIYIKDTLLVYQLIWAGIVFVPTIILNIAIGIELPCPLSGMLCSGISFIALPLTIKCSLFFFGIVVPILFNMPNK